MSSGGTLEENIRSLRSKSSSSFSSVESLGGSTNKDNVLVDIPKYGGLSKLVSYNRDDFNYILLDRGVWIKIYFYDRKKQQVYVMDNNNSLKGKIPNSATYFAVRFDEKSVGKCINCQIMIQYK
jgi:hypothetical protein